MTTEGTFDLKENNSPSPAGIGRRRLSVTSAGVPRLTNSAGVTTPIGGGGSNVWIHNIPVVVGASPYLATIQETVKVDADTGAITIQLPTAVGIAGQQLKVVSLSDTIGPPVCTLQPFGAETINSDPTKTITTPRERYTLESDGANWLVVD